MHNDVIVIVAAVMMMSSCTLVKDYRAIASWFSYGTMVQLQSSLAVDPHQVLPWWIFFTTAGLGALCVNTS